MVNTHPRMVRERKTVEAMIRIYCKKKHKETDTLCEDCQELLVYTNKRLAKCPYQETKPICAKCTIHCYNEPMRNKIKSVMGYSGPRMLGKHPILAFQHIFDRFRGPKKKVVISQIKIYK